MLDRVGGTLQDVGEIVRASHERYDGAGYPDRLRADEIPRPARVVSVADAYSAMTTHRAYSDALAPQAAAGELRVNAGSQFDPLVVEAALTVLTRDETRTIALTHG
jgi:HD-GYP domain-containing protein (c-di-GMP phosphodiesterase class II)